MFKSWLAGRATRLGFRFAIPVSILALCGLALADKAGPGAVSEIGAYLNSVSAASWALAALFTGASLWSVGRYDVVAHRHLGTQIEDQSAHLGGSAAIGLAQSLGFGVVTGALARWRMLEDLSMRDAFALSAFVSVSFVVGWATFTALVCLFFPAPEWTTLPALFTFIAILGLIVAIFTHPRFKIGGRAFQMPTLRASGAIFIWTAVDTVCAAAALFVLLPAGADVGFGPFLPLFLIALGTALIGNTPGGVGPFELMMLGLLPNLPSGEVLGSIAAFRIVYYAIPALLGAVALISPLRSKRRAQTPSNETFSTTAFPRSETGVIFQNGAKVIPLYGGVFPAWTTAQTVTCLFDPTARHVGSTLASLKTLARNSGRSAALYKTSRRFAAQARAAGWAVAHLADDAIVRTQGFDTSRPAFRQLRRKLRGAEKARVYIEKATCLPIAAMAGIDARWQQDHKRARGGTMGRFAPEYVAQQHVWLAHRDGVLVAYATFHKGHDEWGLDLMRHAPDMPDGTMHALVHAAIMDAQHRGIARINLASVTACPDPASALWRWAAMKLVKHSSGAGLRQSKSSFAPEWHPRYHAAPSPIALTLALIDITREIHHPPALEACIVAHNYNQPNDLDENYELASRSA